MADEAAIAAALSHALAQDPFYAHIFAALGPGARPDAYFLAALDEARVVGWIDVAPDGASGAALWIACNDEPAATARCARIRTELGPSALRSYLTLVGSMSAVCGAHLPEGAVYLSILGISPGSQGAGLGGRLLARGVSRIDKLRRPASLETFNPRSVSFYERHGFRVAAEVTEPITGCPVWVMVRAEGSV